MALPDKELSMSRRLTLLEGGISFRMSMLTLELWTGTGRGGLATWT
jgi:hypothetical protein